MITIFNRRELLTTYDMAQQAQARAVLDAAGIPYKVRVVDRKNGQAMLAGSRARTGSFGENMAMAYEYTIYVAKEDLERAQLALNPAR
ncbi:MAG TPA: hypothetical protein H9840_01665 [Candidatus Anaerofilum excrementigallinarum]|nr:hypothetical protein [Candidatus Anaerofilum excrementigallinarum]